LTLLEEISRTNGKNIRQGKREHWAIEVALADGFETIDRSRV